MKIVLTLTLILIMVSCQNQSKQEVTLKQKSYKLYRGDKIIKKSEHTRIQISQNSQEDYAVVTLLNGEIEVIKK